MKTGLDLEPLYRSRALVEMQRRRSERWSLAAFLTGFGLLAAVVVLGWLPW